MPPVVVIGGGISGLSTAYYLTKAGLPVTLIEKRSRLGGVIQTEQVGACLVEAGPDSFLAAKPWALELIRELGLAGEVIGSNDHQRRIYICKNRALVPMPEGMRIMAPTRLLPLLTTPLLSWPGKIRMAAEWFKRPSVRSGEDRSVAEFVREHYGGEALEYLAEPLLAGVYGGDPAELSMRSVLPRFVELEQEYGSVTRGLLAERAATSAPLFQTLKGGMGKLVEALAHKTNALHRPVESIERSQQGFRVRTEGDWLEASAVVLACEAREAAPLARPLDASLGELLGTIPYRSSTILALGFRRADVTCTLDGFGFLVPQRERRTLVACTWVGGKFPHRVPKDLALLRCFVAGADSDDESLAAAAREELRELMGITAPPVFSRVYRWPHSMAQYNVGHSARVEEIEARVQTIPGLFLTGNAYHGVGIPDCVRGAKRVAEAITASAGNTSSPRYG